MNKKSNFFLVISILMVIGSLNIYTWVFINNKYNKSIKDILEMNAGYNIDISDDLNIDYFFKNYTINNNYSQKKVDNSFLFLGNDSSKCQKLFSLIQQKTLIFRFSGKFCSACNMFAIDKIKQHFPDLFYSNKIIFIGSETDPRLNDDFYGKQIYSFSSTNLGFSLEKGGIPFFFIIDRNGRVEMIFIPDHSVPIYTDRYLEFIKKNYLEGQRP